MPKKVLSLRLDTDRIKSLENQATIEKTTVTELIIRALEGNEASEHLKTVDASLKQQIEILMRPNEKLTGHEPRLARRVNLPVSESECHILNVTTAKRGISHANLLRDAAFRQEPAPIKELAE